MKLFGLIVAFLFPLEVCELANVAGKSLGAGGEVRDGGLTSAWPWIWEGKKGTGAQVKCLSMMVGLTCGAQKVVRVVGVAVVDVIPADVLLMNQKINPRFVTMQSPPLPAPSTVEESPKEANRQQTQQTSKERTFTF